MELGLLTLRNPAELLIAPGKVRDILENHRTFAKQPANSASFTKDQQTYAISKAERKQRKHFMRYLKVKLKNCVNKRNKFIEHYRK